MSHSAQWYKNNPVSLRRIGGIWWLRIGRLRFAFCIVRDPKPVKLRLVA